MAGPAPGVSKTTKHQNFGWGRPRSSGGGMDKVQCNDSMAQSYARSWLSCNDKAAKTKTKRSPIQLGGSRSGG